MFNFGRGVYKMFRKCLKVFTVISTAICSLFVMTGLVAGLLCVACLVRDKINASNYPKYSDDSDKTLQD